MTDLFPYELTGTQNWQRSKWVDNMMRLQGIQRKRDNFKIKAINPFRSKNNKLKLKEVNPVLEDRRLTNEWINNEKKRGVVFKFRTRAHTPWEQIHRPYLPSLNKPKKK
jgi:hypothetical protein